MENILKSFAECAADRVWRVGDLLQRAKTPRCAALQSAATQWRVPATLASTHNTHIERRHRLGEYTHMGYGRIFNISENTLSFTSRIVLLNVILLPLQYCPQNCFGGDKSTLCNLDILFKLKVIFCWCRFYGGYYIPNEYLWTPCDQGQCNCLEGWAKKVSLSEECKNILDQPTTSAVSPDCVGSCEHQMIMRNIRW